MLPGISLLLVRMVCAVSAGFGHSFIVQLQSRLELEQGCSYLATQNDVVLTKKDTSPLGQEWVPGGQNECVCQGWLQRQLLLSGTVLVFLLLALTLCGLGGCFCWLMLCTSWVIELKWFGKDERCVVGTAANLLGQASYTQTDMLALSALLDMHSELQGWEVTSTSCAPCVFLLLSSSAVAYQHIS